MADWNINFNKAYKQHILKPGRYKCHLADVKMVEVRRGERFCDVDRGQSPDDRVPKILCTFMPINPAVYEGVPTDASVEIGIFLTPSFDKKAKLPGFLSSLSKDGVVPQFEKGPALETWIRSHIGHEYAVGVAPNEAGTRNTITSLAYLGEGSGQVKKEAPKPKQASLPVAAPTEATQVPFDSDEIPF